MTRHDRALGFTRDFNRKFAKENARRVREEKKKAFEDVVTKGKIETYGDLFAVLGKLSRRAKEIAVLNRIQTLAGLGYDPVKIIERMEPKKEKIKNAKIKSV